MFDVTMTRCKPVILQQGADKEEEIPTPSSQTSTVTPAISTVTPATGEVKERHYIRSPYKTRDRSADTMSRDLVSTDSEEDTPQMQAAVKRLRNIDNDSVFVSNFQRLGCRVPSVIPQ